MFRNLKIMYPEYKNKIDTIVFGGMGFVLKCLVNYLKLIWFNKNDLKKLREFNCDGPTVQREKHQILADSLA